MLKQLRRTNATTNDVANLESAVADFAKQISSKPQLDSVLVKNVRLFASSDNPVPHLLGREYVGWQLTDLDANAVVWRSSTQLKDKFLTLRTSADCTVSILVF